MAYMTIKNCPKCGGTHFGSNECPYKISPCVICGIDTIMACSDCAIDSGGKKSVHVCNLTACMDAHETACHSAENPFRERN